MFNSPFLRVKDAPEINSGEIIVESAGYVPAQVQIESMIYAGQRLTEYRKHEFGGSSDEEAEENFDVTSNPGFDMADASQLFNMASERLKSQNAPNGDSGDKPLEDGKEVKEEPNTDKE